MNKNEQQKAGWLYIVQTLSLLASGDNASTNLVVAIKFDNNCYVMGWKH